MTSELKNMSLFRYIASELTRGYRLEREEEEFTEKRERVYTFMKTPRQLEKLCWFGFLQCVDAFLFIFTFLPLRVLLALARMLAHPCLIRTGKILEPAQKCDLLKCAILVSCCFIINQIDTSMMYHLVRGQATIKLYVFFNMLDVADRLLSSFGQDALDALFWTATEPRKSRRQHLGVLPHLVLAIIYVVFHALLILFQATVLNVAFNSHNKALLTIMMSNNFVEIKGNLFKKVDKSHLYQIACSDVKERFNYVILLSIVFIRNMTEVNWDVDHIWVILPDAVLVLVAELFVDWGKHAFITKFNEIPADVYLEYKVRLAEDMASSRQSQAFIDYSDLVSRSMGLTPLPLAVLLYRIVSKSIKINGLIGILILVIFYFCLMTFKIFVSIILLGHSYHLLAEKQEKEEKEKQYEDVKKDGSSNEEGLSDKEDSNIQVASADKPPGGSSTLTASGDCQDQLEKEEILTALEGANFSTSGEHCITEEVLCMGDVSTVTAVQCSEGIGSTANFREESPFKNTSTVIHSSHFNVISDNGGMVVRHRHLSESSATECKYEDEQSSPSENTTDSANQILQIYSGMDTSKMHSSSQYTGQSLQEKYE